MGCPPGLQAKQDIPVSFGAVKISLFFLTRGDIINTIKYPKINIANFLQRPNDLVYICQQDKTELVAAGLLWEKVEKLTHLFQN
jgi:hypothetical protein